MSQGSQQNGASPVGLQTAISDTNQAPPNGSPQGGNPEGGSPANNDPVSVQPETGSIGMFYAFRIPNYRLLWLGNALTSVAQWIQQTTMGWVVYDLTGSGSLLGGVNAVRTIPTVLITPIAGLASDRISRNVIVAVSQVALFLCTFLLAVALMLNKVELWHLFAFSILAGAANAFNMPARQTMVFDVVPRHVLPNAIALSNLAFSISRTIGPVAGGALIVAFGPANNFFIQSFAYLSVMITVLMIHFPARSQAPARKQSLLHDMAEGYSFAFKDPQARLLILMSMINPLFLIPLHLALLPIYAKTIFEGGASSLGIMLGAIGFGGFFGGLLTAALNKVDRRGLLQIIALLIYSLSQAAFSIVGAVTGQLWLAVPFLSLAGAAESLFNTTNQTVLQLMAPDHLRGRLVSVLQFSPMVMPLGVLNAGIFADIVGAPTVGATLSFMAFGVGLALLIFSPRMRNLRLSQLGRTQEQDPHASVRVH